MAEVKSYQFTINPVKNRTVYLWYMKVKEREEDAFSAIIRYALENYYESSGQCISIAKLHDVELPSGSEPVKINLYIGRGTAAKLLETMKANGITKTKVIHAILEGGIEFVPETEKETIYLPPKKSGYSGVLMAMSDILQTKAGDAAKPVIKEPVLEPVIKKNEPRVVVPEKKEIKENQYAARSSVAGRKKTAAALSGKIG